MSLSYPPPYQDITTLAQHLCLGTRTVEELVRQGKLPGAIDICGKRLWSWKAVCKVMDRAEAPELEHANRVREATRRAVEERR